MQWKIADGALWVKRVVGNKGREPWIDWTYARPSDAAEILTAAVKAERERCAKIVEEEGDCRHVDHVQGFCACADKAAAIRSPEGE